MINRITNFLRRKFWSTERYARYLGVNIGKDCYIASSFFGSEPYLITIGDHVQITANVKLFTHGAGWVYRQKHPKFDCFGKIKIGNNVYLGNGVMIMPGVTVGNNVIIGAGSIVTKSVADNCIVAGNPAKVIGNVDELEARLLPYNVNTKSMNRQEKREYLCNLSNDHFIKK